MVLFDIPPRGRLLVLLVLVDPSLGAPLNTSAAARAALGRLEALGRPWATKDPRMSLVVGEWLAMLEAAQDGDLAAVQRLLGVLGRADAEDHDGNTPLSEAACSAPATQGRTGRKVGEFCDFRVWTCYVIPF